MDSCIFCKIIAGEAPGSIVYEDERALALMDVNPVTVGHTLVIPRQHYAFLADMDEPTGMHLFKIAQRMAAALRESGVRCEGVNLFLADGEAALQDVFHVHLHVIPRYKGDSFQVAADWDIKPSRAELDRVAGQIRAAYRRLQGDD
jgi:histidine triad (HIT) family protein